MLGSFSCLNRSDFAINLHLICGGVVLVYQLDDEGLAEELLASKCLLLFCMSYLILH